MTDTDELFTLKNAFYLGSYREAIDEASTLKLKSDALRLEKDVLVQRSYLGLGQSSKVLSDINEATAPVALLAVRALARYLTSPDSKQDVVAQFETWLADVNSSTSPTVQALAAIVYIHESKPHAALRALRSFSTLESLALSIQVYLRIDRVDLAEKQLRVLQERDDESALYQLCAAQVSLALGGERYQEAFSTYQEMLQRYGEDSVSVTNGLCAALVCLGRHEQAESALKESLAKEPANPETLITYLTLLQNTGRGFGGSPTDAATANKLLATLKKAAPGHPYVSALNLVENSFDRVAAGFK
jgi:coatomer protein complex subunit epsilon